MTAQVTLTGTGIPHASPQRADPGTLVRSGSIALQFDAGRATLLRLSAAGLRLNALSALLLTHVHSDHVVGLPDLVMTWWIEQTIYQSQPLAIVAAEGVAARFVRRMSSTDEKGFDGDLRGGGYEGKITVGTALLTVTVT